MNNALKQILDRGPLFADDVKLLEQNLNSQRQSLLDNQFEKAKDAIDNIQDVTTKRIDSNLPEVFPTQIPESSPKTTNPIRNNINMFIDKIINQLRKINEVGGIRINNKKSGTNTNTVIGPMGITFRVPKNDGGPLDTAKLVPILRKHIPLIEDNEMEVLALALAQEGRLTESEMDALLTTAKYLSISGTTRLLLGITNYNIVESLTPEIIPLTTNTGINEARLKFVIVEFLNNPNKDTTIISSIRHPDPTKNPRKDSYLSPTEKNALLKMLGTGDLDKLLQTATDIQTKLGMNQKPIPMPTTYQTDDSPVPIPTTTPSNSPNIFALTQYAIELATNPTPKNPTDFLLEQNIPPEIIDNHLQLISSPEFSKIVDIATQIADSNADRIVAHSKLLHDIPNSNTDDVLATFAQELHSELLNEVATQINNTASKYFNPSDIITNKGIAHTPQDLLTAAAKIKKTAPNQQPPVNLSQYTTEEIDIIFRLVISEEKTVIDTLNKVEADTSSTITTSDAQSTIKQAVDSTTFASTVDDVDQGFSRPATTPTTRRTIFSRLRTLYYSSSNMIAKIRARLKPNQPLTTTGASRLDSFDPISPKIDATYRQNVLNSQLPDLTTPPKSNQTNNLDLSINDLPGRLTALELEPLKVLGYTQEQLIKKVYERERLIANYLKINPDTVRALPNSDMNTVLKSYERLLHESWVVESITESGNVILKNVPWNQVAEFNQSLPDIILIKIVAEKVGIDNIKGKLIYDIYKDNFKSQPESNTGLKVTEESGDGIPIVDYPQDIFPSTMPTDDSLQTPDPPTTGPMGIQATKFSSDKSENITITQKNKMLKQLGIKQNYQEIVDRPLPSTYKILKEIGVSDLEIAREFPKLVLQNKPSFFLELYNVRYNTTYQEFVNNLANISGADDIALLNHIWISGQKEYVKNSQEHAILLEKLGTPKELISSYLFNHDEIEDVPPTLYKETPKTLSSIAADTYLTTTNRIMRLSQSIENIDIGNTIKIATATIHAIYLALIENSRPTRTTYCTDNSISDLHAEYLGCTKRPDVTPSITQTTVTPTPTQTPTQAVQLPPITLDRPNQEASSLNVAIDRCMDIVEVETNENGDLRENYGQQMATCFCANAEGGCSDGNTNQQISEILQNIYNRNLLFGYTDQAFYPILEILYDVSLSNPNTCNQNRICDTYNTEKFATCQVEDAGDILPTDIIEEAGGIFPTDIIFDYDNNPHICPQPWSTTSDTIICNTSFTTSGVSNNSQIIEVKNIKKIWRSNSYQTSPCWQ